MNLLAMFKRLSILPGSQNHQKYEFLTVLVTNSSNKIEMFEHFPKKVPKSKNIQKAIKTQKTSQNRKNTLKNSKISTTKH